MGTTALGVFLLGLVFRGVDLDEFVTSIRDVTPIPHNGCRPRKRRRV